MPILDMYTVEFFSRSPEQTRRVGMRLGSILETGDLIGLKGELGSGKTTITQGIATGWGTLDTVSSPSFILVNMYRRPDGKRLFHLDAYRINQIREAEELDIDTMLRDGPLIVEWANRIEDALPAECLWVSLSWLADEQRKMTFEAKGTRYETMLVAFQKQVFGGY